mgnify:CR=1 FL=1
MLVTVTFWATAAPALAADLSKVKVKFSDNINKDCFNFEGYDPVWGCFKNDFVAWPGHPDLRPDPTIYIKRDIPSALLPYVFLSNLSLYLTVNYSDQELAMIFNPVPTGNKTYDLRKSAANSFVTWVLGGKITPTKANFFREALLR